MGAAILTRETDIGKIMLTAGLGLVGVFIMWINCHNHIHGRIFCRSQFGIIFKNISEKWVGVVVTIIKVLLTIFTDVLNLEGFLYLIGFSICTNDGHTHHGLLHIEGRSNMMINWINLIIWGLGFT